ncbi:MAG: transcriptional regulator [Bacillota bacterium]
MSNNTTTIQGTGIICKGNVEKNYEQVPMELFEYIKLDLISHTDLVVYVKLLQLYNVDYGYAFPTVSHLMIQTRIGGKTTIHNSLDNLENVGLLKKGKASRGNNIYFVYKPLDTFELYSLVPDKVEQLEDFENKQKKTAELDKVRQQEHIQNKQEQVKREQAIQAKQIVPTIAEPEMTSTESLDEDSDEYLLSVGFSAEKIRKMRKLGKS